MNQKLWIIVLLVGLLSNCVSAVLMDPSVDYMAEDWTLNSRSSINVDYINLSSSWINLGSYGNITFADNVSSSESLVELYGNYALGTYSTILSVDIYAPSDWTTVVSLTPVTNNSENDTAVSLSYTQVNTTHRRYSGTYNPSNTLSQADMGYFDVNVSVTAYNATLQYSGWNVSEDVFEVYMLNPVTEISSGYNSTFHSVNFSWGATEEVVYYFDNYNAGEAWAGNPANMVDGDINTASSCTADPDTQLCTSNTCAGADIGNITNVYVRCRYMTSGGTAKSIILRPIWNGTQDMDDHSITANSNTIIWSDWYDITNDTNAPASWNFTNVDNLDIDIVGNSPTGGTVYCYIVELKVIYDTSITNTSVDAFVVVRNNNSYPDDPSDGYEAQNSTSITYDVPLDFTEAYFMIYAYNDTTKSYSEGTRMPWGCLGVSVYNESAAHQAIGFDIEISDQDGDAAYKLIDQTNTLYINFDDIPYGDDTIIVISNSSYRGRTYTYDLASCNFYNYTFYLPPIATPGAGGGSGDSNDSILCLISVIDELDQPLENANMTIKRYINTTDSYNTIGRLMTDGNGQVSIWLVPNQLYLFDISKENYVQEGSKHWIPTELLYTKTFMLNFETITPPPDENIIQSVDISASLSGTTITVIYNDTMASTSNVTIYFYATNITTASEALIKQSFNTDDVVTVTCTNVNTSHTHRVVVHYNHSHWGHQTQTFYFNASITTLTDAARINVLLNAVVGPNPIGWGNLLMFLFLIAGMYYADQRDAGKVLILIGGIFLFLNIAIGFNTTLLTVAGGVIPTLFVAVGIISIWNDSRKSGVST